MRALPPPARFLLFLFIFLLLMVTALAMSSLTNITSITTSYDVTAADTVNGTAAAASTPSRSSRVLAAKPKIKPKTARCEQDPQLCGYFTGGARPDCCGSQCVDTRADDFNCGRCGKVCKFTERCCAGKCVDLNFDKRHCGSCGNKCTRGVMCIYGMCDYA